MLTAVLSGFLFSLAVPVLVRLLKGVAGALFAVLPAFLFAYFLQFVPEAAEGRPWRFSREWVPGHEAALLLDPLALLFALTISALSLAALIASAGIELGRTERVRLLQGILIMTSGALGFVLADGAMLTASFAVATTLAAFVLVTAEGGAQARKQGLGALLALFAADTVLLIGLVAAGETLAALPALAACLVIAAAGLRIGALTQRARDLVAAGLLPILGIYILLGVTLIARLAPGIAIDTVPRGALIAVAVAGGLFAAATGLRARRIASVAAAMAVTLLGLAVLHIVEGGGDGIAAALLTLIVAAVGPAMIALAAAGVAGDGAEAELSALTGALRKRPIPALVLALAALAAAGIVPSLGMLAAAQSLAAPLSPRDVALASASVLAHGLLVAMCVRILRPMVLRPPFTPEPEGRNPGARLAALVLLALFVLAGVRPLALEALFLAPVVLAHGGTPAPAPFWPQGAAIGLAALSLLVGGILAAFEGLVRAGLDFAARLVRVRPWDVWGAIFATSSVLALRAKSVFARLSAGRLAFTLILALAVLLVALGILVFEATEPALAVPSLPVAAIAALGVLAAILALTRRRFLPAALCVTVTGFAAAVAALAAGTLDLAYVLALVAVTEVLLLLLLVPRLEAPAARDPVLRFGARALTAFAVGASAALFSVIVPVLNPPAMPPPDRFAEYGNLTALLVHLIVFGVAVSELVRARRQGAS